MTIQDFIAKWAPLMTTEFVEDLKKLLISEGHAALEIGFAKGQEFERRK